MKKEKSALEREVARQSVIILGLLVIVVLVSIIGIGIVVPILPEGVRDFWDNLFNNILGAAVGAALVDVVIVLISRKTDNMDTQKQLTDILVPEEPEKGKHPPVYYLYRKDQLGTLMKNTLSAYTANDHLAEGYLSYITHSSKSMRINEVYNVKIGVAKGDIHPTIQQDFRHTAVFERFSREPVEVRLFFTFERPENISGDKLDEVLSDPSYTFREDINSEDVIEEIEAIAGHTADQDRQVAVSVEDKRKILDAIGLQIVLYGREDVSRGSGAVVRPEDYSFYLIPYSSDNRKPSGLKVCVPVPEKFVVREKDNVRQNQKDAPSYYAEEHFVSFTSKISLKYRIKENKNSLYFVYSRPAASPKFSLTFLDEGVADTVEMMPFLSFDRQDAAIGDGVVDRKGNTFTFWTDRTVFPRSGVAFSWVNPQNAATGMFEDKMKEYGLVDIAGACPGIEVELKYTTSDNFTGHDVYGDLKRAYVVPEIAGMLWRVQARLSVLRPGCHLRIYDAARPVSTQRYMFEFVKGTPQEKYVADPSVLGFHNYGLAVDLTVTDSSGKPLDMGSGFDEFSERSNIGREDELVASGKISEEARANRIMLREIMEAEGFTCNPDEWWHFQKYTIEEAAKLYRPLNF